MTEFHTFHDTYNKHFSHYNDQPSLYFIQEGMAMCTSKCERTDLA